MMKATTSYTKLPFQWANRWIKRNAGSLVVVALLLVVWEVYSRLINERGDVYFPSIDYVVSQTIEYQDLIYEGLAITVVEVVTGFVFSVVMGIALGIIFAESYVIRQSLLPGLVFAYSIPHAVIAPVFILWFGNNLISVSLFVAWFGFFTVFINTITGFNQVDDEFKQLGEITGATRWQMIRKIKFWSALPHICGGIKVALQQSIVGAIIAEFIATGGGLGFLIILSNNMLRTGLMFGVLIVLMILSIAAYNLVEWSMDVALPNTE